MKTKVKDCLSGLLAIVFSVVFFVETFNIKSLGYSVIGASFFPKLFCILMFCIGLVLFISNIKETVVYIKSINFNKDELKKRFLKSKRLILSMLFVIVYLYTIDKIGFVVSSSVYLFLQIVLLTPEISKKKVLVFFIISVSISVVVFAIFTFLLKISLPSGILI